MWLVFRDEGTSLHSLMSSARPPPEPTPTPPGTSSKSADWEAIVSNHQCTDAADHDSNTDIQGHRDEQQKPGCWQAAQAQGQAQQMHTEQSQVEATWAEQSQAGQANQGREEQGQAGQGQAAQGQAGQGQAGQGQAGEGQAGQGQAGQGQAGQGQAEQGQAGQGQAGEGQAEQGRAGQGQAEEGQAEQGQAGQGQAEEGINMPAADTAAFKGSTDAPQVPFNITHIASKWQHLHVQMVLIQLSGAQKNIAQLAVAKCLHQRLEHLTKMQK